MQRLGRGEWISKPKFHDRLARWFRETREELIGEPTAHGRTAWLWVRDGHTLAKLQADTTRAAVAEYLVILRSQPSPLEWHVVPSATGHRTRIAFGPDRVTIRNFHLYADQDAS